MEKQVGPRELATDGDRGNNSRARQHTVHFNNFFISSDSAHSKYVLPFGAFSDLEAPFTHTAAMLEIVKTNVAQMKWSR